MLLKRTCTAAPREVVRNLKILLRRPQEPKTTVLGQRAWSAINTVCFGTHKRGRQLISAANPESDCMRHVIELRRHRGPESGRRVIKSRESASEPDKSRTLEGAWKWSYDYVDSAGPGGGVFSLLGHLDTIPGADLLMLSSAR